MMQTTQSHFYIRNLLAASIVAVCLCMALALSAHAQEINPAPGTYVYGSSSELSPYATLGQSSNSGTLAPTGESQTLPILLASLAFGGGLILLYGAVRLHRQP